MIKIPLSAIVFFGSLLSGAPTWAATDCLDQAASNALRADFQFVGFGETNLCDPKNILTQTLKALQFVRAMEGTLNVTGPFALNALTETPYDYFKKRVNRIVFESPCQIENAAAYVFPSSSDRTMHICPLFASQSALAQASTLVHEARHFDGFHHVDCVRGTFASSPGNGACDRTYPEAGSYGVEVSFYLKILQNPKSAPALRRSAKMEASDYLINRFVKLPADLQDGAFLTEKNNSISFFNGESRQDVLQITPGQKLLMNDFINPEIRDDNSGVHIPLTWGLATNAPAKAGEPSRLLGVASSKEYLCLLDSSLLRCFDNANAEDVFEMPFSRIHPQSLFERLDENGVKRIYFTTDKNQITALPLFFRDLKMQEEQTLDLHPNEGQIFKMQTWQSGDKDIVLTLDGRLLFLERRTNSWTPLLSKSRFRDVIAPVVWSKSLKDL